MYSPSYNRLEDRAVVFAGELEGSSDSGERALAALTRKHPGSG
jgi:hypothetical protein